jgi:hypothetical protein
MLSTTPDTFCLVSEVPQAGAAGSDRPNCERNIGGDLPGKSYGLLGMEVMPDHFHIFVSAPPKISPAESARFLRGAVHAICSSVIRD